MLYYSWENTAKTFTVSKKQFWLLTLNWYKNVLIEDTIIFFFKISQWTETTITTDERINGKWSNVSSFMGTTFCGTGSTSGNFIDDN